MTLLSLLYQLSCRGLILTNWNFEENYFVVRTRGQESWDGWSCSEGQWKNTSEIPLYKIKRTVFEFFIWKFSGLRKIEFNLLKWQISIRYKLSHISWLTMNDNLWIIILCNRNWFGNTRNIRFSGFSDDFVDYFLPLKRFKSLTHLYESLKYGLVFWPATWLRNWPLNFFEFVFHKTTARTIELTQSLKTRLIMTQFRWLIT